MSAGGVAYRRTRKGVEIAVIGVGPEHDRRWQLPKGLVEPGEVPEISAIRETREEAGVETELIAPLQTVEYWYYGTTPDERVRYHKFVHFYLLEYRAGDVRHHDAEVNVARWVPIRVAISLLTFKSERAVAEEAEQLLEG